MSSRGDRDGDRDRDRDRRRDRDGDRDRQRGRERDGERDRDRRHDRDGDRERERGRERDGDRGSERVRDRDGDRGRDRDRDREGKDGRDRRDSRGGSRGGRDEGDVGGIGGRERMRFVSGGVVERSPERPARRHSASGSPGGRAKKPKLGKSDDGNGAEEAAAPVELDGDMTAEEIAMMKAMGIPLGFDTTQGKEVADEAANASGIKTASVRSARQYMNRRGGFNRELPEETTGKKVIRD